MAAPGRAAAPGSRPVPAPVGAANLAYGGPRRTGREELAQIAERLGIGGLLDAMPARLSGGQAHRVALGRLLLAPCDALLLDEPYTGLDASLRRGAHRAGRRTGRGPAVPSVLVAHELADAQAFADRLAVLDHGEILQLGAPAEVVLRPRPAGCGAGRLPGLRARARAAARAPAWPGVHPDRVLAGASRAGRGAGRDRSRSCRPSGAGWEADVAWPGRSCLPAAGAARRRAGVRVHGAGPAVLRPRRHGGQPPRDAAPDGAPGRDAWRQPRADAGGPGPAGRPG